MLKRLIVMILLAVLICNVVNAYEHSSIDIVNVVEGFPGNHYNAFHSSGEVSDGLDDWDMVIGNDFCSCVPTEPSYLCEVASMYSDVSGHKCLQDYRPCDSIAPFEIDLFLCGNVSSAENYLWIDYYVRYPKYETFDDKTIILESDRLLYGRAVDVRRIIKIGSIYGGGIIPLIPVATGNYRITSPYGSATLYIGTKSLGDINADGICDLKDFACLVADWQKPQDKYRGDITGIDGVPDGFVDFYDLQKMAHGWLH